MISPSARSVRAVLILVAVACLPLALSKIALAQSSVYSQYGAASGTGQLCTVGPDAVAQSVCDVTPAAAGNVAQGTDAANDAMAGTFSSASASASAEAAPAEDAPAEDAPAEEGASVGSASEAEASENGPVDTDGDTADEDGGLASITELPETGGPVVLPVAGSLLFVAGLLIRRISTR